MNKSSLMPKCFPALMVLFFLCGTASASEDIWTFGLFGKFGPSASTTEFSAPDINFTMRFITSAAVNHFRPEGDKFEMSLIGVELNVGGKLSGFVVETALLGTRSLELTVDEGRVKIELFFPTSLYTGPVSALKLVASQYPARGVVTFGARMPGARTAPFTGTLYLELLPRLTPGNLYSFMWLKQPGGYVGHRNGLGKATFIASDQNRQDATFRVVQGLAARNCFSFESVNNPGKYLRHKDGRIRLDADDGGQFAGDATYCETFALGSILGINTNGFSLVSYNLPGYYIMRVNDQLLLQLRQTNVSYESAASYEIAPPLWHQMSQPDRPSVATGQSPTSNQSATVTPTRPPVTPAQTEDTGAIDVNSYYRLTNSGFGDTKSLEAKQVTNYSIDMLMGETSDNNRGQYWIFVQKGKGYQVVNAAIGNDRMVHVNPKAPDTEAYLYPENPIVMMRSTSGIAFEVKALGDGYFVLSAGGSQVLGVIPTGHRYYRPGTPALVPSGFSRNIPSTHKWKLTKVGPIR